MDDWMIANFPNDYHGWDYSECTLGPDTWGEDVLYPPQGSFCAFGVSVAPQGGANRQLNGCKSSADNDNCPGLMVWAID